MSTPINNGGPAFPHLDADEQFVGMSLRDYFAAKAAQGMLADPTVREIRKNANYLAETAYSMADAMLKARSAK